MKLKPVCSRCLLLSAALAFISPAATAQWQDIAYSVPDPEGPWRWEEGNDGINKAKASNNMAGVTVYAYVRNTGAEPARLEGVAWNGTDAALLRETRESVWWRMNPPEAAPGAVAEVTLRLRNLFEAPGVLKLSLSNGVAVELPVSHEEPVFRIQSMAYTADRRTAYLYVERTREDAPLPEHVLLDGETAAGTVEWLSPGYAGDLRPCAVRLETPLRECAWHTWTVLGSGTRVGATLRVISQPARFGTYGSSNVDRIAENGLDGYNCFGKLSGEWLDKAAMKGVTGIMHVSNGTPPEETRGHPNVYGYCIKDEPDCGDYSADAPMHQRIGENGPLMAEYAQRCAELDPDTPAILNLDLTFTPANWYTYGTVADITTADSYPVTVGHSITFLRDCVSTLKRASAPHVMGYVYQGSWEFFGAEGLGRYVGGGEIRSKGYGTFVNPERQRGFARPLTPAEVNMQMAYAVGAGARSLWSFIDATEGAGGLIIIGSSDLPGIWSAIGLMSRTFRNVAADINLSHPMKWATADKPRLWVNTLVCGERCALVAVVNEDFTCDKDGFIQRAAGDVVFTFPDFPWLKAGRVERLWHGSPLPVACTRSGGDDALQWRALAIQDVALYRVTAE